MDRLLQLRPPFDLDTFEQTARTLTPTAALFVYSEGPAPCDTPDASPTPINLVTLIFPKAERKARLSASYFVAVNLDATGTVTWATIAAATARNPDFEREAIRAVEGSTFTPEIFRCNPVYGTYVMVVTFGRP
jgi:TonB family protein